MKKIIWLLMFAVLPYSCFAFLGTYEPGEFVTFTIVCLEDGGKRDAACTSPGAGIYGPGNVTPDNATMTEVNEDSAPGLWKGNYTVQAHDEKGLFGIFINLTNVNGTPASTVLHFQVVGDTHGLDATGANTVTILSNQIVIQGNIKDANQTILENISNSHTDIINNLTAGVSGITAQGDSAWITATGFSTHNAADVWTSGTRTLTTADWQTETNAATRYSNLLVNVSTTLSNISAAQAGITAQGDSAWITATGFQTEATAATRYANLLLNFSTVIENLSVMSGTSTGDASAANQLLILADLKSMNLTILGNITNAQDGITAQGDSAWITATGFSTHNAADVWTSGTRTLTTADWQTESNALTRFTSLSDGIQKNASNITTSVLDSLLNFFDSNTTAAFVWNFTKRALTFYPTTTAVVTLDISRTGILNETFYFTEVAHILNDLEPEIDKNLASDYFLKVGFDVGILPANITAGYIIYWIKKTGTPSGDLFLVVEGSNVTTIDVAGLTTSYTKNISRFNPENFSDPYVTVEFRGLSSWTGGSSPILGLGEVTGENSFGSTDEGISFDHLSNELTVGLVIEFNETGILGILADTFTSINDSIIKNLSNDEGFFDPYFTDIQGGLQTVNLTVKDINTSIIQNLSNDIGFFDPLFAVVRAGLYTVNLTVKDVNISILENISNSIITSAVSALDKIAIGREAALQVYRQNLTISHDFNRTSFSLLNSSYNYTGLGIRVIENYTYDNESYLNSTSRSTDNG